MESKESPKLRKKIIIFLLKCLVSGSSLYLIFLKADIRQVFAILKDINILYVLTASLLYVLAMFSSSLRLRMLLPGKFGIGRVFLLTLIGAFFSNFLPSIIGGDAVKAYYLNRDAKKLSSTLASIFMDRYMGFLTLMVVGLTFLPFAFGYFGDSEYRWLLPLIFVMFAIGSLLFFGLRLGGRFHAISEFYEYLRTIKGKRDVLVKAFLISLFTQFLNLSKVVVLAIGMGADIPLLTLFVFLPIVITITSLPISVSGLGLREGSFVILLGLIGITPEVATSLSLIWFFSLFLGSVPGLAAYLKMTDRRKGEKVALT